jgi:hypothetical protein
MMMMMMMMMMTILCCRQAANTVPDTVVRVGDASTLQTLLTDIRGKKLMILVLGLGTND